MEIIMIRTQSRSAAFVAMQRMFDEGFATGETGVVDEVCSPDLVEHQFGTAGVGDEAVQHVKAAIRDVHPAIPDATLTIEDAPEVGDTICIRVRALITVAGPYLRSP